MDPYLGPVAGALLAAFVAGLALGVVRLRRLSLEWWRRRLVQARGDAATVVTPDDDEVALDPATAPPVFGALALIALVALLGVAGAAGGSQFFAAANAPSPVLVHAPPTWAALVARASTLLLIASLGFLLTLAAALAVSLLDRAIVRLLARFVPAGSRAPDDEALDMPALLSVARGPGEPFGVGFASIVLFASTVFAFGALLVGLGGGPSPVPAVAIALLAVPVAYAAAAERSNRPEAARLRRDAALRQLAVAPVWIGALVFAPAPWALVAFALAGVLALPGAPARAGSFAPPWGGDAAEPNPVVRTLSRVAHGAWIVILAALPIVMIPPEAGALRGSMLLALRIVVAVVALLAARALVRRFVLPSPTASAPVQAA